MGEEEGELLSIKGGRTPKLVSNEYKSEKRVTSYRHMRDISDKCMGENSEKENTDCANKELNHCKAQMK